MPPHSRFRLAVPSACLIALLALSLCAGAPAPAGAVEYHWIVGSGSFQNPGNWLPPRTAPAADDRLVFGNGIGQTVTVTHLSTGTIGQFVVTGNTQLVLSGDPVPFGPRIVTVNGAPGTDFELTAGSSLRIVGDKPIDFIIKNGANAEIGGTYVIDNAGLGTKFNRFQGEAAEAIQILWGGIFEVRSGQQSNPFNRSLQPVIPNMVRFHSNSTYFHNIGDPPPIGACAFDPGSRFIHNMNSAPALVGRTFADFEFSAGSLQTVTGAGDFTMDSLIVSFGSRLNLQTIGIGNVKGSIHVRPDSYLRLGSTGGDLQIHLNGTAPQTVQNPNNGAGGPGLTTASGLRLVIDNPTGVRLDLGQPLDMAGILDFRRGVVSTGSSINPLRFRYQTGQWTGASQANGWFDGYMLVDITPGNPAAHLPFGNATSYAPSFVTVNGLSDTARVGGGFEDSLDASWFEGSQLHPVKRLAGMGHYVTVQRDTNWTTMNANFFFPPPPAGDPLQFVARVRTQFNDQYWRATPLSTNGVDNLTIAGLARRPGSPHHYFAFGEPSQVFISAQDGAVEEGAAAATTPVLAGSATVPFRVSLSEPAVEPVQVFYGTADGTAEEGNDFEPTFGTLVFPPGDTAQVVTVPVLGDGDPETHETVYLTLSGAIGATIDRATGEGEILDDDDVTPPTAAVVWPNGGETVIENSTVDLQWTATDNVIVESVVLQYSTDGGENWDLIAVDLPNTGTYAWQAPFGLTQQALLNVVASDHRGQTGEDVSDAVWRIWGVDGVDPVVPLAFGVELASPNPSSSGARFRLSLTREQAVRLVVHDVRGRQIGAALAQTRPAGTHVLEWTGAGIRAGVYFVSVEAEEGRAVRRIVRLP